MTAKLLHINTPLNIQTSLTKMSQWLFSHIYSPVSAILILSDHGVVAEWKLFDTDFGFEAVAKVCREDSKVVLISNHPEGDCTLSRGDQRNIQKLSTLCQEVRVYLYFDRELLTIEDPDQ